MTKFEQALLLTDTYGYGVTNKTSYDLYYEQQLRYNSYYEQIRGMSDAFGRLYKFNIKKVIFNNPATIVIWKDDSKTIVKCGENDIYDPEKGLAMAIAKRALGDKGNYFETFKKWIPDICKDSEK